MKWAAECSRSIGEAFDLSVKTLEANPITTPGYAGVLRQLLDSCHLSSESVLILVANVKLWDAESLLRSVIEGTFKFVYLCLGSPADIEQKFTEYYTILPDLNRLKRHTRLEELLTAVRNPDSDEWRPFRDLLLPEDELQRLRQLYPRAARQQIEQRWSFHSIASSFANSGLKGLDGFRHLFFGYGNGSHTLHQDSDGVGMLWERNQRSQDRRESIEIAHGAREVGDLSVMGFLRYFASLHLCGLETKPAFERYLQQHELHDELSGAAAYWHDIEYPKA